MQLNRPSTWSTDEKLRTPYGVDTGAALRYREGYEAALNKVVKIAQDCGWNGPDFTRAFCDETNRLGVGLGPDPDSPIDRSR